MSDLVTLADGSVLDVARWPLPAGVVDGLLNRSQLATAFGVSENSISKWMTQGMPVSAIGQNGVAYEFRLSHCWAWKQQRDDAARAARDRGDALAAQAALAFRNLDDDQAEDEGGLTADEIRKWADAEYARNKVAEQRGNLVRRDRVNDLLEDLLSAFQTSMQNLPDFCERELGISPAQVETVQTRVDKVLAEARNKIERKMQNTGTVVPISRGEQGTLGF